MIRDLIILLLRPSENRLMREASTTLRASREMIERQDFELDYWRGSMLQSHRAMRDFMVDLRAYADDPEIDVRPVLDEMISHLGDYVCQLEEHFPS